jgi:hypothetical protein
MIQDRYQRSPHLNDHRFDCLHRIDYGHQHCYDLDRCVHCVSQPCDLVYITRLTEASTSTSFVCDLPSPSPIVTNAPRMKEKRQGQKPFTCADKSGSNGISSGCRCADPKTPTTTVTTTSTKVIKTVSTIEVSRA